MTDMYSIRVAPKQPSNLLLSSVHVVFRNCHALIFVSVFRVYDIVLCPYLCTAACNVSVCHAQMGKISVNPQSGIHGLGFGFALVINPSCIFIAYAIFKYASCSLPCF